MQGKNINVSVRFVMIRVLTALISRNVSNIFFLSTTFRKINEMQFGVFSIQGRN